MGTGARPYLMGRHREGKGRQPSLWKPTWALISHAGRAATGAGVADPGLTVLAGLAVEAGAAAAGAGGGFARAVVQARALQAAGGTVATGRAG